MFSLNHLIRPRQHVRRNRQADLLGRLQIDDELKLRRLLHWRVGWLGELATGFQHHGKRNAEQSRSTWGSGGALTPRAAS